MSGARALPVEVSGDVVLVQRAAVAVAEATGFDRRSSHEIALVATELATNIVRHAGRGTLIFEPFEPGALRICARDRGPGIADFGRALEDGCTARGPVDPFARAAAARLHSGLGAVRRLSDSVEYWTDGTVNEVRALRRRPPPAPRRSR
ncbi:MAG TPA: ATP-binding protein [Polyangiaceae bacterium]|nr:ATP-binding protein [Polyangiaceae bacterium]